MISFYTAKLLSLLVYPLSLSLLLLVLAFACSLLRWRRISFYTTVLAVTWLYLCSTVLFANFLMGSLERSYVPRAMSVIAEADAIVLLGGAMRGDTHMGTLPDLNQHADRLVHAAALYKAGKAPIILLTGGGGEDVRSEAEQMKDILMVMGVPARSMLLEDKSRTTYDNAVFSAQMLRDKGLRRILLVSSGYHMPRAEALFSAQGLEVVPAPTDFQRPVAPQLLSKWVPDVASLSRSTYALHEIVGYWVYRLRGWL